MEGIFAGIGAAATWALANYIFSHNLVSCSPMLFNFLTGVAAILIFAIVLPFQEQSFPPTPFYFWIMLQLSGVVGIGLGDSLFFGAIKNIGPRKTLLMETLASPFTGLISFIYFGDSIGWLAWVGIFIVVVGIIIVVNEQQKRRDSEISIELVDYESNQQIVQESAKDPNQANNQQMKGYLYAVGAMFCQALGMVLSRDALSSGSFNPIASSFIRQVAGQFSVLILLVTSREKIYIPQQTKKQNIMLLIGILLGQVICLWFQQLSLQHTRAEIAQTLMSTSPLFALALSKYQGEVISQRAVVGSLTAFVGVCLVVNGN
ncbi:hypothetical protein ABPG74_009493 [Tetrahymena malaccensis]